MENKSPEIIALLSEIAGFDVLANPARCPLCGKPVDFHAFRDELSIKEYGISHICQSCQDEVFAAEDDDDE